MLPSLILFLVLIVVLTAFLHDRALVTLIYLLAGITVSGVLWSRSALRALTIQRRFEKRAFLGEEIRIRLEVRNHSWFPTPWVRLHESLPVELAVPGFYRRVIDIPPRGKVECEYRIRGKKRGYYPIGPLFLRSGDLFGLGKDTVLEREEEHITVFPKILPLPRFRVPSYSPMGTLPSHQLMFEDPSRVAGKRDYQQGDSLRRIDWKASAAAGRLQIRLYEPSISLEVSIFLNLCTAEYEARTRIDATELAVVTAASLASHVASMRQPVGLETNGYDPLHPEIGLHCMAPHEGTAYLTLLLEKLARVQPAEGIPFARMLRERSASLAWGTTQLVITGMPSEGMFQELFRARRWGLRSVVFLTAPVLRFAEYENRARELGIGLFEIRSERDIPQLQN